MIFATIYIYIYIYNYVFVWSVTSFFVVSAGLYVTHRWRCYSVVGTDASIYVVDISHGRVGTHFETKTRITKETDYVTIERTLQAFHY